MVLYAQPGLTKSLTLYLWIIGFVFCGGDRLTAQEHDSMARGTSEVSEIECFTSDYGFLIGGNYYRHKEQVFFCAGDIISLTVVDNASRTAISEAPTNAGSIVFSGNVTDSLQGDSHV